MDTMDTTVDTTTTTGALEAAPMLLIVSGGSVSATEALRRGMAGVNRTGPINRAGLPTLTHLLSAWTAPAARGWT